MVGWVGCFLHYSTTLIYVVISLVQLIVNNMKYSTISCFKAKVVNVCESQNCQILNWLKLSWILSGPQVSFIWLAMKHWVSFMLAHSV